MNESDTFLDQILDGVTTAPRPAPTDAAEPLASVPPMQPTRARPAAEVTDLDQLLDGLSPAQDPNGDGAGRQAPPSYGNGLPKADETTERLDEPISVAESAAGTEAAGTEASAPAVSAPAVDLPVAAPHEILGLPGQAEVSHFDLANEVNGIAVAEPAAEVAESHSFAAIAREIAATVDDSSRKSNGEADGNQDGRDTADRASFYVRSARRRRKHRTNRFTLIQVVGLVLLLVVGLAAEWEYVSRGHSTTAPGSGLATAPSLPAVRLPRVISTRVAGTYFQFESSGSAESLPFKTTKPSSVAWTVRCGELSKAASTQIIFLSSGRSALNILVGVVSHGSRSGKSAALRPGTYSLVAHAPGFCTWRAQGIPHA